MNTWSLTDLIEYVVGTCHRDAKKDISILYDIAHVVTYRHSDRHPHLGKLVEVMFLSFDNLLHHMTMEENTFFPMIEQATPEYISEMAEKIRKDHDAITNDLKLFRELTRSYTKPDDSDFLFDYLFEKMKRFDREMTFSIHLENTILLPKAIHLCQPLVTT